MSGLNIHIHHPIYRTLAHTEVTRESGCHFLSLENEQYRYLH